MAFVFFFCENEKKSEFVSCGFLKQRVVAREGLGGFIMLPKKRCVVLSLNNKNSENFVCFFANVFVRLKAIYLYSITCNETWGSLSFRYLKIIGNFCVVFCELR